MALLLLDLHLANQLWDFGQTEKGDHLSEPGTFAKKSLQYRQRKAGRPPSPVRLYQTLARKLVGDMRKGVYGIGDRLPAERELAAEYKVNRAAVREALLALEVFGLIEVRIGSGAYVVSLPDDIDDPGFAVGAFELMEARMLIEGEAAALAAIHITPEELAALEQFVALIASSSHQSAVDGGPDEAFHRMIAKATRNKAVELAVGQLWDLRATAPKCAVLQERARTDNVQSVVDEHRAILDALRAGDAEAARQCTRAHLAATMEHLLAAAEYEAVAQARASVAATRQRYSRTETN